MASNQAMLEVIRRMGDPDELAAAEDLVLLQLDRGPARCSIPTDFVDDEGCRFTADCKSFIACRKFLTARRIPVALFAGCPGLRSMKAFLAAARGVLSKTETLIIVHNRDKIEDVVAWFPSLTTLVLYHDLKMHVTQPRGAKSSRLQRLYGTVPGIGASDLYISGPNLESLLASCPNLSQVQAPMNEMVMLAEYMKGDQSFPAPVMSECSELTLGRNVQRQDLNITMLEDTRFGCLVNAGEQYPNIEQLRVTTSSKDVVDSLNVFPRLRHLSVMYSGYPPYPFDSPPIRRLWKFPLTHLALINFESVSLSAIGKTWPALENLSLSVCDVCNEDVPSDAFPQLTSLRVCFAMPPRTFRTLLRSVPLLKELYLDGETNVTAFLMKPRNDKRPVHNQLERLTLATKQTLGELDVSIEELREAIASMSALKTISTDSYDIRLFVQHYYPNVTLTWTACTVCAAEFPKIDKQQKALWHTVHG